MDLGYDQKLYILAFDHRGSFQSKFFGIEGEPEPLIGDLEPRLDPAPLLVFSDEPLV